MRIVLTLLICTVLCSDLAAQDYVIKNNHDTVYASIHAPVPSYYLHLRVYQESPDGSDIEYHPMDLVGFRLGRDDYETHDIGNGEADLHFLKVIVKGVCSLYEFEEKDLHEALPTEIFLLKREGESFHEYNFKALKKGRDDYFSDAPELVEAIQSGEFKKSDVIEIVHRYNQLMKN